LNEKVKMKKSPMVSKGESYFEFENFETLFIKTHFVVGKALRGGPY
jgi:hypothetical protein